MSNKTKMDIVIEVLTTVMLIIVFTLLFQYTQIYYKNFIRGERHFKKAKYQKSLPYLVNAFKARPESLETAQYLVWTYQRLDREKEMAEALKAMAKINPEDYKSKNWLADTYYGMNDYESAEQYYRELLTAKEDFTVRRKLAEVLLWQQKYDQAIPFLKKLLHQKPEDYQLTELLADAYSWKNDYDAAITLYKLVISKTEPSKEIKWKLAEALRYAGRDAEATEIYNQYLRGAE